MKIASFCAFILSALIALPASAKAPALPQDLRVEFAQAQLAGQAKLTVWGFKVYNASLWVSPGFRARDFDEHAFVLDLSYLRQLSGEQIAERSLAEMQRATALDDAKAAQWLREMREIFPNVRAGDHLTGVHRPGGGTTFLFNGKRRGEIRDPEFARLFFGIWLAHTTSEPRMRQELLAKVEP